MTARDVDGKTVAIWGNAMCRALLGDRRELVEMLRCGNTMTQDLADFLAWLLDERKNGRPPLPEKFKTLDQIARSPRLLDAYNGFVMERAHYHFSGENFPYKQKLAQYAKRYGVTEDKLENKLRRSSQPRKKTTKRRKAKCSTKPLGFRAGYTLTANG